MSELIYFAAPYPRWLTIDEVDELADAIVCRTVQEVRRGFTVLVSPNLFDALPSESLARLNSQLRSINCWVHHDVVTNCLGIRLPEKSEPLPPDWREVGF